MINDTKAFIHNGLEYLPFPNDLETLKFWQERYDESILEYTKQLIKGRLELTKKYFERDEEIKLLEILNKMMVRWWR